MQYKVSKTINKDKGSLTYQISEEDAKKKSAKSARFETYFFDDQIKFEVF
jgi:hypothetical protein